MQDSKALQGPSNKQPRPLKPPKVLLAPDLAAPFIGLVLEPNPFGFVRVILSRGHAPARRDVVHFSICAPPAKSRDIVPYSNTAPQQRTETQAACNQSAQKIIAD